MDSRLPQLLTPFLKYLGGQSITEDSPLPALGLDSMQSIELLFAIEDTFGITLADEYLNDATFATAGTLWSAIATTMAAEGGGVTAL
ncbi:hypothetical protein GCM10007079_25900 [Nocardiopsis terrae]|uniref:Acyl carrier protein n=1 Tax=Nocardiopsis terrae TaxID=372655 RepID=A0ABR9HFK0_9ACTN|nr:phosphopantetheine-binding protein [Nocardiopsis terrae]MBE1457806.1 acyl carrier protein [Nocardiopsis terrae]GHC84170.1 hypothetical protein GCM10007079_25900 [Nocardiopsis terrae]